MHAWIRFLRSHAAITRELSARLEAQHGLTLSDHDVLVQLVDIARTVLLTASGITRLLDGLERSGKVAKERCDSDARVTYAVLTDEGVASFQAAQKTHLADIDELFASQFDERERVALAELLGRLPLAPVGEACKGGDE